MAIGALAHVLPWQNESVERHRNRYYGKYLGFCRDRSDPTLCGRIRVHLPALLGAENVEDNWLDWCMPSTPGLTVPPLNAPVWIQFEQGIITHGQYDWGWVLGGNASSSAAPIAAKGQAPDPTWLTLEAGAALGLGPPIVVTLPPDPATAQLPKYPYNKVFQSEGGVIVEVDDSPNQERLRLYHPAGATILIEANGSVHIRTSGAIYQESNGDYTIAIKGGGSFKVVYEDGTGFVCGASGFHVTGTQATILGRAVLPNAQPIQ
jgi:hypothetical protein